MGRKGNTNELIYMATKKEIAQLDQDIQDKMGIELTMYRNEDAAEKLIDLLLFPKYVLWWILQFIVAAFVLYLSGFWLLDLVIIEYLLYFVFGIILFIASGLLGGLVFLTYRIRSDIKAISMYAFDVMKRSIEDLARSRSLRKIDKNNMPLLYKGVIHIVIIPSLKSAIRNKLFIIGYFVAPVVTKLLTVLANRIKFEMPENTSEDLEDPSNFIQTYKKSINLSSKGVDILVNSVSLIVRIPLFVVFSFVFGLLLLFLFLIH